MLQTQKVIYPKIQSFIDIKGEGTIKIENSFSLTVDYDGSKENCLADFSVSTVCKDHPDWLSITVQVLGFFGCEKTESDAEMKDVHSEAYDILFPYMQSIIADLTTKAGLPPLMLEKMNIDFSDIEIAEPK